MIIVAGHLVMDPGDRETYLQSCVEAVRQGRQASGCFDFSATADLLDDARVNVFERWRSRQDLEAFRTEGPSEEQQSMLRGGSVAEYAVDGEGHQLLG